MSEINKILDKSEIEILEEKDSKINYLISLNGLVIAGSIVLIFACHSFVQNLRNDDQGPVVECPKDYNLDGPVRLKPVTTESGEQFKKMVFGFTRRYILNQFPRSADDVETGLTYIFNHSKNKVQKRYKGYLENLDNFKANVENDVLIRFYDSNLDPWRISSAGDSRYKVEVDGFLVRSNGNGSERGLATLVYYIESGKRTIENPEGLWVYDDELLKRKEGSDEIVSSEGL